VKNPLEIDFFISYTKKDEKWATWIAEVLESNGCKTIIQAWDFKTGGNFINDMHEAIKKCKKVVIVLSNHYLKSDYCQAEWQNIFISDPVGRKARIIPIRVENASPDGLLSSRTYIDIYGISKSEAEKRLIELIHNSSNRKSGGYPGAVQTHLPKISKFIFNHAIRYWGYMIDDDEFAMADYIEALEKYRIFVQSFSSAINLLKALRIRKSRIDVVILDIRFYSDQNACDPLRAWRSGVSLYYELREILPDTKIVALSNTTLPEARELFENGDDLVSFFSKYENPPEQFAKLLRQSLDDIYDNN